MLQICTVSRRNNTRLDISGVLYYNGQAFFQVLEGPQDDVRALADRIRDDPRHRDFQMLLTCSIRQRLFSGWSMKFVDGRRWRRRHLAPDVTAEVLASANEVMTLTRIFELRGYAG